MSELDIYQLLDSLHIKYHVVEHGAAHTIEDMEKQYIEGFQYVVKNLFVRDDKKKNYYFVIMSNHKKIQMNILQEKIHSRKLSFASQNDLYRFMKLLPGEVTPFGLLNDKTHSIHVIFDQDIQEVIGIHPLRNDKMVFMKTEDLITLIKQYCCSYQQINIEIE